MAGRSGWGDWGVTAVRVATGAILFVAGLKKWSAGIGATVALFVRWGIPVPAVAAPLVGVLETVGGALLVLGVLTRWLGLLIACEFAVATLWVEYRLVGWDAGQLSLMLFAAGLLLFLNGSGRAALRRD